MGLKTITNSVLTSALDNTVCPVGVVTVLNLRLSDSSVLPTSNSIYGVAYVNKRTDTAFSIVLINESREIYIKGYGGGSWSGWLKVTTQTV